MSLRRLSGWEPSVDVTYVWQDGVKVGERRTPEPEFCDDDRWWLDALAVLESDQCPDCRMPLSDSADPDGPGYLLPPPSPCRSCKTLHDGVEVFRNDKTGRVPGHLKFRVQERGARG